MVKYWICSYNIYNQLLPVLFFRALNLACWNVSLCSRNSSSSNFDHIFFGLPFAHKVSFWIFKISSGNQMIVLGSKNVEDVDAIARRA